MAAGWTRGYSYREAAYRLGCGLLIVLLATGAGMVTFLFPMTPGRVLLVMGFLFTCPGLTVVSFFRLEERLFEWILAFAFSFAIDAFVAAGLLYAGKWSPPQILELLIGFCYLGSLLLFITVGVEFIRVRAGEKVQLEA